MKMKQLLKNPKLIAQLLKSPPRSKYSDHPLSLTSTELQLVWENCMEPDWWVGAQEGVYTRQDRRAVTDDEIVCAAASAGISDADVSAAFVSRVLEEQEILELREQSRAEYEAQQARARIERQTRSRESFAQQAPELLDSSLAAAAQAELAELFKKHRNIDRMTRKMMLTDEEGNALEVFRNKEGMRAWLYQNGHTPSIDNRNIFVDSEK